MRDAWRRPLRALSVGVLSLSGIAAGGGVIIGSADYYLGTRIGESAGVHRLVEDGHERQLGHGRQLEHERRPGLERRGLHHRSRGPTR